MQRSRNKIQVIPSVSWGYEILSNIKAGFIIFLVGLFLGYGLASIILYPFALIGMMNKQIFEYVPVVSAFISMIICMSLFIWYSIREIKASKDGYIIDFENNTFTFPGYNFISEKSIFDHLKPSYYKRYISRYTINFSDISSLKSYREKK